MLRPRNLESHALITQPRTLNKSQTLATNKAENRCYAISNITDRDYIREHFYLRVRLEKKEGSF